LPAPNDPSSTFSAIADDLLRETGVEQGTGFGTNPGLRVDGKIFAMLVRGEFVAKLPAERAEALVEAGRATRFQIGKRQMREWVALPPGSQADWPTLARTALDFVRG